MGEWVSAMGVGSGTGCVAVARSVSSGRMAMSVVCMSEKSEEMVMSRNVVVCEVGYVINVTVYIRDSTSE